MALFGRQFVETGLQGFEFHAPQAILVGRSSSIVEVATSSAVLFSPFLIRLNLLFLSTMATHACLWFFPMRVSISQSPIRLFSSTIFGLSSMLTPLDRYFFPYCSQKLIDSTTALLVSPFQSPRDLLMLRRAPSSFSLFCCPPLDGQTSPLALCMAIACQLSTDGAG